MGRRPFFVRVCRVYAPISFGTLSKSSRQNANGIKSAPTGFLKKYQL